MFYKEIQEQIGPRNAFLEAFGGTNFENFPTQGQTWWRCHGFAVCVSLQNFFEYITDGFVSSLSKKSVFRRNPN